MSATDDISIPLSPGEYYHIFNRGVNKMNIFYQPRNYPFFLKKYFSYLSDYIDTLCYCLLSNHFHFLIKIKSKEKILSQIKKAYPLIPAMLSNSLKLKHSGFIFDENNLNHHWFETIPEELHFDIAQWAVSEQFRLLFMGYSKAINNQENRDGALFRKPFRRKRIENENYLNYLIWYIHNNAVHHGIRTDFKSYPWSSYQILISEADTEVNRKSVLEILGGQQEFIRFHQSEKLNWEAWKSLIIE